MAATSFLMLGATNVSKIGLIILILTIIHSSDHSSIVVRCQDYEDLNSSNKLAGNNAGGGNKLQPQNVAAFQPSRQSTSSSSSSSSTTNNLQFQTTPNTRQSFQRPVLNRFAQQQQQLSAQASTTNAVVASQSQQTLPTADSQQQTTAQTSSAQNNVERLIKNRANKLEQAAGNVVESRQDQNSEPIQLRSGAQFQASSSQATAQSSSPSSNVRERSAPAETPEARTGNTQPADDTDKQTTSQALASTSAHETVYSDPRFANLFARRTNQKKNKFTPTEQVKAKPTLPSFIKSPPDPKQFTANSADGQDRPITQASAVLSSARQQSNQNRQLANQSQKKAIAAITSNTAVNASNKRLNSQKQQQASNTSRATGTQAPANVTNKPALGNPFNKSQLNSNDPANVIAMARKRLLANNAAQQQQKPSVTSN